MNNVFIIKRWVKVTFLGWLLGLIFILALSSLLDGLGIEHLQFYLGTGMGAGVGFTQRRYLKKIVRVNHNWFWASVLPMSAAFLVFDLFLPQAPFKLGFSILTGSLAMGLFQYRLLKHQLTGAQRWVIACVAGWGLGVATVFIIDYTRLLALPNLFTALVNLLLILGGGVVLGAITGMVLKRITDPTNAS